MIDPAYYSAGSRERAPAVKTGVGRKADTHWPLLDIRAPHPKVEVPESSARSGSAYRWHPVAPFCDRIDMPSWTDQ